MQRSSIKIAFEFWQRVRSWFGLPQKIAPASVEDLPDELETSTLYLVGQQQQPWSAALLCPCGCQAVIQLSLIQDDDPRWRVTFNADQTVTLHPSIWRIKGCRSHFFVRSNRIVWARGQDTNRRQ